MSTILEIEEKFNLKNRFKEIKKCHDEWNENNGYNDKEDTLIQSILKDLCGGKINTMLLSEEVINYLIENLPAGFFRTELRVALAYKKKS